MAADPKVAPRAHRPAAGLKDLWALLGLAALWAVLFLPAAATRALHYEEGRRAFAALDILEHGHWLIPQVLGVDYLAKPPLLPWAIALAGWISGDIGVWAVRALPLAATLAMALAAYGLARRYAGPWVALLAGAATLTMPTILEKGAVGETDTTVTACVFLAFAVWLGASEAGRVHLGTMLAAALLLGIAGLTKGPIPLGFFALGAALLAVWQRRWGDLPRLVGVLALSLLPLAAWALAVFDPHATGLWRSEMRLSAAPHGAWDYIAGRGEYFGELIAVYMPWGLAACLALWQARRWDSPRRRLVLALLLYALPFGLIVALSPAAAPRYAMPAVPAVAVLAALGIAGLWRYRPMRIAAIAAVVVLTALQLSATSGLIPFRTELFTYGPRAGEALAARIGDDPAPVVVLGDTLDFNVLYHVGRPITRVVAADADSLPIPSWVLTTPQVTATVDPAVTGRLGPPELTVYGRRGATILLYRLDRAGG